MYSPHTRLSRAVLVLLLFVAPSLCYIHDLNIKNDDRASFFIESFGFTEGGKYIMTVNNWKVGGDPITYDTLETTFFVISHSQTDSTAFVPGYVDCAEGTKKNSDYAREGEYLVPFPATSNITLPMEFSWNVVKSSDEPNAEGFYNTYFVNCDHKEVTFDLHLVQYNVDRYGKPNYLPAGLTPLPTIYGVFAAVYVFMLVVWILGFIRGSGGKTVNRVHHLMTIVVVLKCLSLGAQSIQEHYTKLSGIPGGWDIVYYIFTGLKTIFFFVIIALIGTGWTFVKPFLSDKDKKIIMIVIPLQILDNVALAIVGETAPGSRGWFTWKDIFRLVDIICCGAVLIPIIWSIKHLREASQSDGKAARNLAKLQLFRQFYLYVVAYIYFTRIIIYLLDATLPFRLVWMGEMFSELATLCFFLLVGYNFRPVNDNPYFKVEEEEREDAIRMAEMANPTAGDD